MNSQKINVIDRLNSAGRPLVLDGAFGSVLQEKQLPTEKELWSSIVNLIHPKEVYQLHKSYINAGADIITTNTFRTNPLAYFKTNSFFSIEEYIKKGVELALGARGDSNVIIAGSNAPAEDCYQISRTVAGYELEYNHKKHIDMLWEAGCDIIWNETQSHWDEIEIISKFCSSQNIPFAVNLYFTDSLKLLSGEPVSEAVRFISDHSPVFIGFNCVKPKLVSDLIFSQAIDYKWGFYTNCGVSDISEGNITCSLTPEQYINEVTPFLDKNPSFIGSCCGSGPAHTYAIRMLVDEIYRN